MVNFGQDNNQEDAPARRNNTGLPLKLGFLGGGVSILLILLFFAY